VAQKGNGWPGPGTGGRSKQRGLGGADLVPTSEGRFGGSGKHRGVANQSGSSGAGRVGLAEERAASPGNPSAGKGNGSPGRRNGLAEKTSRWPEKRNGSPGKPAGCPGREAPARVEGGRWFRKQDGFIPGATGRKKIRTGSEKFRTGRAERERRPRRRKQVARPGNGRLDKREGGPAKQAVGFCRQMGNFPRQTGNFPRQTGGRASKRAAAPATGRQGRQPARPVSQRGRPVGKPRSAPRNGRCGVAWPVGTGKAPGFSSKPAARRSCLLSQGTGRADPPSNRPGRRHLPELVGKRGGCRDGRRPAVQRAARSGHQVA
jgi:hypothetical protein